MVIFDLGLGFGIGCLMRRFERQDSRGLVAIAAGMGVAPAGLAFLHLYPDWDLQYLLPKEALPPWFSALFCFLIVSVSLAGHWLQGCWSHTLTTFGVLYTVYCAWSLTRIGVVTSYANYHAGNHPEFPMEFLGHLFCFGSIAAMVFAVCLRAALASPVNKPSAE